MRDIVSCDPGNNTYDIDLRDDLGLVETCIVRGARLDPVLSVLQRAIDAGTLSGITPRLPAGGGAAPPSPGPTFGAGAVDEQPNVRVLRQVLIARGGTVLVGLACPGAATEGCRGRVSLVGPGGTRTGIAPRRHRIRAGGRALVPVRLTATGARPGARAVMVRVVETGRSGPKTTGTIRPLAVPAR